MFGSSFIGHKYERTSLLMAGLVGLLGGLLWAYFGARANATLMIIGFLLIPVIVNSRLPAVLAVLIIGLNLGLWRGEIVNNRLDAYIPYYETKVVMTGRVIDDSAYGYKSQTEFHIGDVRLLGEGSSLNLPGKVRVRGFGVASIRRGDYVEVSGKLREGYGNRQGSISFAAITVHGRSANAIEEIRSKYFAGVYTALPEPNASLGLGFLVGLRTLLPDDLLDKLSATGLTHIVAVSGYNLTILVRFMRRLFSGRSIYTSMLSSVTLVVGFLAVTGYSPSIVRAAIVSGLALSAWYYGRRVHPVMLIALSAAITAFWNPFYLWFDIGWYLSFAAFAGVLVLAPIVTNRFFKKKPGLLGQVAIETTSAQLMALPIIAVIFGEVSLISLIANMIILPFIPFAMLATFIAGLGGMVLPHISGWFAWPADFLLTFMIDMIKILASVPWALKQIDLNWLQAGFFYTSVSFGAFVMWLKSKREPLNAADVIE